jgi:hypothetical protein
MGEEGPEPQELMESVEHNVHAGHEAGGHQEHAKNKHLKPAITAAALAVAAAIGSLLSGHAANEAILDESKASDQWSLYQAKSTKAHLYEVNKTLLESIVEATQLESGAAEPKPHSKKLQAVIDQFGSKTSTYEAEKQAIEKEAKALENESTNEFMKHQIFSFAVACFQIGIVVASVSILIDSAGFLTGSIATGVIGVLLVIYGAMAK